MLWLTWRQHRIELISLVGFAIAFAALVVFAGSLAQRLRLELGMDSCVPLPNTNANCVRQFQQWVDGVGVLRYVYHLFYVIPALVASYIGGPLIARELERGTHRLAWTQGVSRLRWAAVTLGLPLAVTLVCAVVLALVGGQTRPLLGLDVYRPWDLFDQEGPALVSLMVFGLAVGAFIGAWRRRVLAGMFWGLLVFGFARGVILFELRPAYEAPVAVMVTPYLPSPGAFVAPRRVPADAWLVGVDAIDSQGRQVPQQRVRQLNEEFASVGCRGGQPCDSIVYLNNHDVYPRELYQPADRYWRFQLTEAAIYLALAVALVALTLVILRRRDA